MAETKLTPLYLKTLAQKFDLETITILNISNKNVQGNIGSLGECKNIQYVDLSRNRITVLSGMESLKNLRVLNLSFNKLTSIDVLLGCEKLQKLELQGNLIKNLNVFEKMGPAMKDLVNLYL